MALEIDGEEYMDLQESLNYLSPYVKSISQQGLRTAANAHGVKRYHQAFGPNRTYYKKSDLDKLKAMKPVENNGTP